MWLKHSLVHESMLRLSVKYQHMILSVSTKATPFYIMCILFLPFQYVTNNFFVLRVGDMINWYKGIYFLVRRKQCLLWCKAYCTWGRGGGLWSCAVQQKVFHISTVNQSLRVFMLYAHPIKMFREILTDALRCFFGYWMYSAANEIRYGKM